jgi:cleavage stimulation factor subunit 3
MAYMWTERNTKPEEAMSFLKAGLEANSARFVPRVITVMQLIFRPSFLLNFAYAEAQENAKNHAEVHTMFTKFIDVLHGEIERVEKTVATEASFTSNGSGVTQPSASSSISSLSPQRELARRRTELGIAWIAYMRFARRAEGLKPARNVFGKARKDKWISWEIYEAAGLELCYRSPAVLLRRVLHTASMEYHFTKATDVATRIYETGLKLFGEDAEYVIRYLKFLISINDENSTYSFHVPTAN